MNKMLNNLIMINKMVIFLKSMLEEDIDPYYFTEKITFELNFINKCLDDFWIEYLKFIDIYKNENFLKSYSFSIKRFYKLLLKIDNETLLKSYNMDETNIMSLLKNIQNKIEVIEDHNERAKILSSKEQFINEEEYQLLFKVDEENNEDKQSKKRRK